MIRDFRDYAEGARIETDLCVVGAGPAGIALAREFLGSSTEVLLLDSGGLRRDRELDALNETENVGLEHHSEDGRLRRFGGASWLWAGLCVPFADIDFER